MSRRTKWIGLVVGGLAIVAIAAGALAFSYYSNASAKTDPVSGVTSGVFYFRGMPGFMGNGAGYEQALADALGISLTDLHTAEQKASDAAVQQLVDQGTITQDQANEMILRGFAMPFGRGFAGRGTLAQAKGVDYHALLADALGISVDQLTAAQQKAEATLLDQAVASGRLTQEQADLIKAQQALQSYLNPDALFAQALGISVDQLQADRQQAMSLSAILAQAGKTAVEVRAAEQAAYQAAVQQAVSDGVITQAQADQVLANGYRGLGGFESFGPGFGPRDGHGFGRGGFPGFKGWEPRGPKNKNPNPTPTPSTAPGA